MLKVNIPNIHPISHHILSHSLWITPLGFVFIESGFLKQAADQNLIFGGILNDFTPDVKANDTDLQSIVEVSKTAASQVLCVNCSNPGRGKLKW